MPFRLPQNLESLSTWTRDPTREEVAWYVGWLERELAVAQAALDAMPSQKAKKDPKPADGQ